MWFNETVFYQIYPLTLCGAPEQNGAPCDAADPLGSDSTGSGSTAAYREEAEKHRINRVKNFIPHLKRLGVGAVYLNPVFESDSHGYDPRDYRLTDRRLGTNEDLREVCRAFHEAGMRVVFDGVFNHVGRGFFGFRDLQKNREASPYRDWFRVDFGGNSPFGDGFWYEGWEGHYELVKLNLDNPAVQDYLLQSVEFWVREFDIDGIRLDVAYLLPLWFIDLVKQRLRALKPDAFLLGEVLGDNARRFFDQGHVDAITDYPLYKALWSSMNSYNFFELAHTLKRTYDEMYRGLTLFSFADNHDVERLASKLADRRKLPLVYALLFTLPGMPCLYYGSEWGQEGRKEHGSDASLRPSFENPFWNDLTDRIAAFAALRNSTEELQKGSLRSITLTNRAWAFAREYSGNCTAVAVNIDENPVTLNVAEFSGGNGAGNYVGNGVGNSAGSGAIPVVSNGALQLPPLSAAVCRRGEGWRIL